MTRKKAGNDAPHSAARPSSGAKLQPVTKKKVLKEGTAGKFAPRKPAAKKAAPKKVVTHILSAPKGARTLTHRRIKQAIERVFEERYGTDA